MRKAFTLIEVLVSVALLSILIVFMYQNIDMLKKSNFIYEKFYHKTSLQTKIHKTMFLDLAQSTYAKKVDGDFDRVILQTSNSHFGIIMPYVSYIVKQNTLYRVESNKQIPQKIKDDFLPYLKFEIVKKGIKTFEFYRAKKSFLIVLDAMIFEVAK